MKQRKQKGFTLIELGIVLALIGIGLFFAISKIRETNNTSRAQSAATDVSNFITSMKRYYSVQSAFPTINADEITALGNAGVFPQAWMSGATPTQPFSGDAVAAADFLVNNPHAYFTITSVPTPICVELGRMLNRGVESMSIGRTEIRRVGVNPTDANAAAITTACQNSATNGAANIAVGFSRS